MEKIKPIFERITKLLEENKVNYQLKEHPPTYTSEESAFHRGEPLKIGAKAMVMKADTEFVMAVLPADRKINSGRLKGILNTKNLRFATKEELLHLTALVPGAIPPFGSLFSLPMLVDHALLEEEYMAFNAGSLEKSIKMKTDDYVRILKPRMEDSQKGIAHHRSQTGGMLASLGAIPLECQCFPPQPVSVLCCTPPVTDRVESTVHFKIG